MRHLDKRVPNSCLAYLKRGGPILEQNEVKELVKRDTEIVKANIAAGRPRYFAERMPVKVAGPLPLELC